MAHKRQMSYLMQHKADTDVAGGSVVVMDAAEPFVAVAVTDIKQGEIGTVDPEGVYPLPKAAGALTQGQVLYQGSDGTVSGTSGGTYVGRAHVAAASADTFVYVMLNAFPPAAKAIAS